MKNTKVYKNLLLIGSSIVIISVAAQSHKYEPDYKIVEISDECGCFSYSKGRVFIGDKDYLESITDLQEGDVLVVDERDTDDPNMIIYNSYQITDKDLRNEILSCLLEYERIFPSEWNRSIESLRIEWSIHNLLYDISYKRDHTTHVDLNNDDEPTFNNPILKRTFFN